MHSIDTIDSLVYDWLIRSGYQSTFAKLPSPIHVQQQSQESRLAFRAQVVELIKSGRIDEAISLIETNEQDFDTYKIDFENFKLDLRNIPNEPIDIRICLFLLKLQNFIELLRQSNTPIALNYVQTTLLPIVQVYPYFETILQEILGVLVYAEPETSPMAWLFERSKRYAALASLTNSSLFDLFTNQVTACSPLESLLKQVQNIDNLVHELGGFGTDLDDRKWSIIPELLNNERTASKHFIKTIKNE